MRSKLIWTATLVAIAFSGPNARADYNWFKYRNWPTRFESPAVSHDVVAYTSRPGDSKGSIYPASMGVFYGDFGPVTVRVGGAAPSGTFTDFGPARVSAFSTAGISGDFNNNGAVDAADYVLWRNGGPLQNDPTPGVQSQDYDTWRAIFGQVGDIGSAYTVAFRGTYDDPPKSGIFTKRGGQLTTIAKVGDLMPSTGSPIVLVYTDLAISGNTVAFGATDAGGTTAILMGSGGELTTVAKTGDMTSLGPLKSFVLSPAISGNSVAFAATAGDGTRGIFASTGGELTTIFKIGDPAPVGVFTDFYESGISMGTDGKVAFLAYYDGHTKSGIFTAGGGELTTVVKTGDVLPGVGASYSLGGASMAGDEVAFYALVPSGPSVPYPQSTFFLRKGSEPIQRIASVAELLGTSGTLPVGIGMGRFGFSGYRLAFSFDIQINYGVGIIAVRTIPEPASWLLVALASAAVLSVGTRRRNAANRPQWVRTVALRRRSAAPLLHLLWIGLFFGLAALPAHAIYVRGEGVSADGLGSVYFSGQTAKNPGNYTDALLNKYDAAGNLQWTQQLGTSTLEDSHGVSADSVGNVYISGHTSGSLGGQNAGQDDAFVSKYDAAGNVQWTRQQGTEQYDQSYDVSADSLGNVYISGWTYGSLGGPNAGYGDVFVTKYNAAGDLQWTRQLGTSQKEVANAASVDGLGNVYISGGWGADITDREEDAFVAKYDASGNLQWMKQLGTSLKDQSNGVSVDGLGNVYISGSTDGSLGGPSDGSGDSFLAKYDAAGNLAWARQLGTQQGDGAEDVSADGLGNVYISGTTAGSLSGPNPGQDAFVAKYDSAGNFQWVRQLGIRYPGGSVEGPGVSADGLGNVYFSANGLNAFIGKYDAGGNLLWIQQLGDIVYVPEPATWLLVALASAAVLCVRNRRRSRSRTAIVAVPFCIGMVLIAAPAVGQTVTVNVPGTSDVWLAGMPSGSTASSHDVAPEQSPQQLLGLPVIPHTSLVFSASGLVTNGWCALPFCPTNGPDGGEHPDRPFFTHDTGPENGISDALIPLNAFVGVFLGPEQPNLTPAPSPLDFRTPTDRDYLTLTPGLKQVFFIGDGLTSAGGAQKIVIPDGATRLFLGTMDGCCYSDNSGSFAVQVTQIIPEPATVGLLNTAALIIAGYCWRRRILRHKTVSGTGHRIVDGGCHYCHTCAHNIFRILTRLSGSYQGDSLRCVSLLAAIGVVLLSPFARADFVYSDFSSTAGLVLLREAQQAGTALRLTPATGSVTVEQDRGAAWFAGAQEVRHGFSTSFQYQVSNPVTGGGQGFAFVVQTTDTLDIGDGGFRLGHNNINNNLAVEFDTRQQPQLGDPNGNHISVKAGVGIDPPNANHGPFDLGNVTPVFDLDDGAIHTVRITYQPGTLQVYVDDLANPLLAVGMDLSAFNLIASSRAFVGFTSGVNGPTSFPLNRDGMTNGSANHDILKWSFDAVPEPSAVVLLSTALSAWLASTARRYRVHGRIRRGR